VKLGFNTFLQTVPGDADLAKGVDNAGEQGDLQIQAGNLGNKIRFRNFFVPEKPLLSPVCIYERRTVCSMSLIIHPPFPIPIFPFHRWAIRSMSFPVQTPNQEISRGDCRAIRSMEIAIQIPLHGPIDPFHRRTVHSVPLAIHPPFPIPIGKLHCRPVLSMEFSGGISPNPLSFFNIHDG